MTENKARVTVLTDEHMQMLENRLPKMVVTNQTTQLEIAVAMGVQMVLKELRKGFVYGS
jgi:hypothetical protein